MIDANQCRQQLTLLLGQQVECAQVTNHYLVEMRQAIAENRLADLNAAMGTPQTSMQKADDLEQQRRALMQSYGFTTDREGMEHCIAWCGDSDDRLSQLHQQLLEALSELDRSLQISNLLVNKGKQGIERALNLLTSQPSGTKTYTAAGTTHSGSSLKRTIARA